VQVDACIGVGSVVAVLDVAADWATKRGELDAYLVWSAGDRFYFDEVVEIYFAE